jgi:hypothetical protein
MRRVPLGGRQRSHVGPVNARRRRGDAALTLDDILARLNGLPEAERAKAVETAINATKGMKWFPNLGAQTQAYFHPADVLLYGGQGGGGKSDLALGLAFTAHKRSLIMRRRYVNLGALIERAVEINGSRDGFNGSPPPKLRTADGRLIEFGAAQHPGDEQGWQGQPHDLLALDESTQFLEAQVRFLLGWLRTTEPGQRVRALLGTNPPVDATGDWIIGMFRPWLDVTHPNPAKAGEVRWYVTAPDGTDLEVGGPEPVDLPGAKSALIPLSRSFVPAKLADNPYLIDTGYQAKLDGLPEPIRSAVRDGNFMAARADDEYQVIPTQWIIAAQARWSADGWRGIAMTACGLDIGAGRDETTLAMRHGGWYAPLETVAGEAAKDPAHAAALVIKHRKDNCPVVVDVGGGFGGASLVLFKENGVPAQRFNGAEASSRKTSDGTLSFINKRAEAWWRFREELDPNQQGGSAIALPPDPKLIADLSAPTWKLTTRGIQIESKDDIRARLGRSPDRGDAVVMALSEGQLAAVRALKRNAGFVPKVVMGGAIKRTNRR